MPSAVNIEIEILRLVLPLLSKYGIPPNPINYAVWYEYVAREKMAMRQEVMEVLESRNGLFPPEESLKLFKKYVAEYDESRFLRVQDQMQKLTADLMRTIRDLSGETSSHQTVLDTFVDKLDTLEKSDSGKAGDIKDILKELIHHTRSMAGSSGTFKSNLEAANNEIQSLRVEIEKVRQESETDSLTGLHNRRAFDKALSDAYANFDPNQIHRVSLIMIDLDHFKSFNDKYGHLWGDKILKHVALVLKQELKGRDFLARFGGEEFSALLLDTNISEAYHVAENLRKAVEMFRIKTKTSQKNIDNITISLGVTELRAGETIESFIQRADEALYSAKQSGRNRAVSKA